MNFPREPEEVRKLADIDPEYAQVSKNLINPFKLPEEAAQFISFTREMGANAGFGTNPTVSETNISIPARDGFKLGAIVFKPSSLEPGTKLPLIVLYHGGGYTVGQPEHCTPAARDILASNSAVIVAPQYRLAPEHPYPAGINDCWDSLRWIAVHATDPEIGASPATEGFILGGFSAGGSMASVLAHLARDEQLSPQLTGLFVSCGSNCPPEAVPERFRHRYLSRTQPECNSDVSLNSQMLQVFMSALKPDLMSHMFNSFLWPSGHKGLPPVYFQVAGREFARDEALIYADVLKEEGSDVRVDVYKGLPHVFWVLFPQLEASKRWNTDTQEGFTWLLKR